MKNRRKAIKSLKDDMKKDILGGLSDKLKGKMAVKVIADSPEDLKEGLEKAEDMLDRDKEGIQGMLKEAFEKRMKKPKKEEE